MYIGNISVDIGSKIQFKSVNRDDTNIYSGRVTAITTATMAKLVTDIAAYHTVIMAKYPVGRATSWQALTYIIVTDGQNKSHAMATDWIDLTIQENSPGAFKNLDDVADYLISVAGVADNAVGLLTYLRAGGYNVNIVSSTATT